MKLIYGISSFKVGDIDPTTGGILNPVEFKDIIYRDTVSLIQNDGTTEKHYNEMDNVPQAAITEPGEDVFKLSVMEAIANNLEIFLGGTVTTLTGVNTWHKPAGVTSVEKYIEFITVDGTKITIPRAHVVGKKNFDVKRNKLWLIDVTLTPLKPTLGTLDAVEIEDAP
jgi:hypothetical protein